MKAAKEKRLEGPEIAIRSELINKEVLLCYWWDCKDVIHCEQLQLGEKINLDLYCGQLMRLSKEIKKKRTKLVNSCGVIFQENNARSHTSLVAREK